MKPQREQNSERGDRSPSVPKEEWLFPFEKLRVWQAAREWIKGIYRVSKRFPEAERFGITSQLTRAAISVANNLAEGSGRKSRKDQAHFTHLAYSSLLESMNLLILASDQGFLWEKDMLEQREQISSLSAQLTALHNAQLAATS